MATKETNEKTNASTQSNVITNLVEKALKIKIFKVTKQENQDTKTKFFLISAINLETKETLTLSVSELMVEKFGFAELIKEGVYITEDRPAIYTHLNAVYVPNDGNRYGYKTKEGAIEEYRANNTYIVRQFHGTLSSDYIQAYEMSDLQSDQAKQKADKLFKITKGREYVAGISSVDDEYYIGLFVKM